MSEEPPASAERAPTCSRAPPPPHLPRHPHRPPWVGGQPQRWRRHHWWRQPYGQPHHRRRRRRRSHGDTSGCRCGDRRRRCWRRRRAARASAVHQAHVAAQRAQAQDHPRLPQAVRGLPKGKPGAPKTSIGQCCSDNNSSYALPAGFWRHSLAGTGPRLAPPASASMLPLISTLTHLCTCTASPPKKKDDDQGGPQGAGPPPAQGPPQARCVKAGAGHAPCCCLTALRELGGRRAAANPILAYV